MFEEQMIIDGVEYITTEEAATKLGVSLGRVRQMVARNQLERIKIGNTNLVKLSDVEERIEQPPPAGWPKGKPRKSE